MDQLTMDDITSHNLWLGRISYHCGVAVLKEEYPACITRFIRTFTDPGAHRSKLLKLTGEKYG